MGTTTHWHIKSIDETVLAVQSDLVEGLSAKEASARLELNGPNVFKTASKKTIFQLLLGQFHDALIYVLLGAVVITMAMGEYIDGVIILAVVLINAVLGVIQEVRAGNALEALRKMAAPHTLVKREGQHVEIPSQEVVVGDILVLDAGRYVAADIRLIESANLQIDESALTGESVAVEKDAFKKSTQPDTPLGDRSNMAYMSTLVTYGRGLGVVVNTANATEVGKIAHILQQEEKTQTPLEIRLNELGKTIGKIAVAVCITMFVIGYLQGRDVADMFLTAVSLAVASIPEGLAAIVAIVLSIGVTKMARHNAIIKKLPAVETLGSVNIVCSDKTGTLTQNKMTVTECFTFSEGTVDIQDYTPVSDDIQLLCKAMVLSSDATLENGKSTGDPTEIALLALADRLHLNRKSFQENEPRIAENPFDSERKMLSTLHRKDEAYVVYVKGAIDNLLAKANYIFDNGQIIPVTDSHITAILNAADAMSEKSLRTLTVAYKPVATELSNDEFENSLVLIGLVGMIDPPREEVKDTIRLAREAGITTVMITGDHKNTAFAIAKALGIAETKSQAISGVELDKISADDLQKYIQNYRVFARVSPQHKVNIVKAFKAQGNIVSMTGDGVNDAPSLQAADIGVAMGITGTDVTKNASDMILADDNFSTIINAIEQGRNIYNNIKKSVVFLLSSNLGEVIAMLVAIIAGMPVPLLATQLLWINLITDTLPALALGMDPGNKDVMKDKPRNAKESFFAHGAIQTIVIGGILIGLVTIVNFYLGYSEHGFSPFDTSVPEEIEAYARTLAFMTIIACQLFFALSFRHNKQSVFKAGILGNTYLLGSIVLGFALQLIVLYVPFMQTAFRLQPLHAQGWLEVIGLGLIPLVVVEVMKLFKAKTVA
jgi:Ca2+-transporting ATPase